VVILVVSIVAVGSLELTTVFMLGLIGCRRGDCTGFSVSGFSGRAVHRVRGGVHMKEDDERWGIVTNTSIK
jgi:hypothetical protein